MMKIERISKMLEHLPTTKINSRSFNDVFQVDGMPLWHLIGPFLKSSYFPSPFKPLREIERDIENDSQPSLFDKIRSRLSFFMLRKWLTINEKIKMFIARRGKKSEKVKRADVLFVNYTQVSEEGGKLKFYGTGKIIDYLKMKRKIIPLVLICDPISKNSLFKLNKYRPLLYRWIALEILQKSKQLSKELNEKWKNVNEDVKVKMFSWGGKNYGRFFMDDMNFLFSREFLFTLIKYYLTFKDILKKHDLKMVFLSSFIGIYEVAALAAAHKLDKKILYVSHGYTRGLKRDYFIKNVMIAASGPEEKRGVIKRGIKEQNVFVTGSPFYDEIIEYKRREFPKRKKTITLLTSTLVESKFMEKEKYFELIRGALAQLRSIEVEKIIIKLHPAEKYRSEYESIVKSLNLKNVEINQGTAKMELYAVIAESDLLMGFGSTALLEGLMMGKDVIHLDMFLENPEYYTFREGTLCISKINKLAALIKKVMTDKSTKDALRRKRESYLHRSFYRIDGKASERVSDLIEKILGKMKNDPHG